MRALRDDSCLKVNSAVSDDYNVANKGGQFEAWHEFFVFSELSLAVWPKNSLPHVASGLQIQIKRPAEPVDVLFTAAILFSLDRRKSVTSFFVRRAFAKRKIILKSTFILVNVIFRWWG